MHEQKMKFIEFLKTNRYLILKTLIIYLNFSCLGAIYTLMGSVLLDLQVLVQRSFTATSRLVPARSIGYLIGATTCGLYEKRVNDYLVLAIADLIGGISLILAPWFTNLESVFVLIIISGFAQGMFDVYCNVIIFRIWDKNIDKWLQGLYMSFGIGALITPIFTRPFLLPNVESEDLLQTNITNDSSIIKTPYTSKDVNVQYPFMIIGGILSSVAIPIFLCYLHERQMKNVTEDEPESEKLHSNVGTMRKMGALVMTGILTNFSFGTEAVVGELGTAFAVKADIKMDKKTAVLIATVFWTMFSFYRVVYVQLNLFIKKNYLFNMNLLIMIIGAIALVFKAAYDSIYTWIAFTLLGIGYSPIFPIALALLSEYFYVTNTMTSFIFINGVIGEIVHTAVLTHIIEDDPVFFTYYLGLMAFLFVIISFALPYYCESFIGKTKYNKSESESERNRIIIKDELHQ